ncbi:MAG TPA: SDR family oxidoreductase [Thermoanaerobaculia bacterium]|nr:SDR family oxidoreductase [Thermoanaerobaculia bacterium]
MADGTRSILLTGVTRGLGRALALRLAELGHVVIGCGRTASAIEEMQYLLGEPHGMSVVDVASAAEVETWARRVLARHPPIDLLINNAGVINTNARLWEVPEEEFVQVVDVNLKGTYHVLRAFLPSMIERGQGVVVNYSSGWGRSSSSEVAPYCATKWGIEGMTKALAEELPRGLAAVALNPGVVHTAMLESCYGKSAKSYPGPERWAERAAPFLLNLGPKDNGKSLTMPGF